MVFFKKIFIVIIVFFGFTTCTIFKKNIQKPVVVAMPDRNIDVSITSFAFNSKYINNLSKENLADLFLTSFESEAKSTKNITFKNEEADADFIIKIRSLSITESSKTEKISDDKSPYNGQEVVLNSVECTAVVEIINARNKTKALRNCSNSKSRTEKLKNNRDIGDLISGANKDHTTYRTKLLDDNICNNLTQDVGRRIWVPITRRIAKAMK